MEAKEDWQLWQVSQLHIWRRRPARPESLWHSTWKTDILQWLNHELRRWNGVNRSGRWRLLPHERTGPDEHQCIRISRHCCHPCYEQWTVSMPRAWMPKNVQEVSWSRDTYRDWITCEQTSAWKHVQQDEEGVGQAVFISGCSHGSVRLKFDRPSWIRTGYWPSSDLKMGWALSKPRVSTRFTSSVKAYLCAKFDLGEKTGLKADPTQVSKDMRNARDQDNKRRFSREWLSKTQIQSYFSQLASSRRKRKELLDADDPSLLVPERLRVLKCESFFFCRQSLQALIGWGTIRVTSHRDAN